MASLKILKSAIAQTGALDPSFQAEQFSASHRATIASALVCIALAGLLGLQNVFLHGSATPDLFASLLFVPVFLMLLSSLRITRSILLTRAASAFILGLSGVLFVTFAFNGSTSSAMYCTVALSALIFLMMPVLRLPVVYSLIPCIFMITWFIYSSTSLNEQDWALSVGLILSILVALAISESAREIDEYQIFKQQLIQRQEQQKQIEWSYMTGRLLRHEISNQLIALSSSLDLMARDKTISDKLLIAEAQNSTSNILDEINELALASEWSAIDSSSETDIANIVIRSLANYNIDVEYADGKIDKFISEASRNILIYATNRIAKELQKTMGKYLIWGVARIINEPSSKFEVDLKAFQQDSKRDADYAHFCKQIKSNAQFQSALSLLKTQGLLVDIHCNNSSIKLAVSRQPNG